MPDFIIAEYHDDDNAGYRMATRSEVEEHMTNVQETLDYNYEWHICALLDGTVAGPGYNYELTDDVKELGHKLLTNAPSMSPMVGVDFIIAEYHDNSYAGYRMATRGEVEEHMMKVQEKLDYNYEWHICALLNGTVAGPGYNYELTDDVKELGHKLLTNAPSMSPMFDVDFIIAEYHDDDYAGYRMATRGEVEEHMMKVQEKLDYNYEWHICALLDGTVAGPGYNYELTDDVKELGHKLLTNAPSMSPVPPPPAEFCVEEYDCCKEDGWRLARRFEVKAYEGQVHQALDGLDWHICSLVDGTVSGPGYNHEVTNEVTDKGHKLMIYGGIEPPPVAFKIVEQGEEPTGKWRLARRGDLQYEYMQAVRDEFYESEEDREWHMCSLLDGVIKGPGYGFEQSTEADFELGHKLLINY